MEEAEKDLQSLDKRKRDVASVDIEIPNSESKPMDPDEFSKRRCWQIFREKLYGGVLRRTYMTWRFMINRLSVLPSGFSEAFALTFAAEWGDRSQIATLALGASRNIYGVNIGAMLGHLMCTSLAVLGGQILATRISARSVLLAGGTTFLLFAIMGYLLEG